MPFAWGAAGRPIAGEIVSGDAHVVQEVTGGLLVAVMDGLGHGVEAAVAASAAVRALEGHLDRPIIEQFQACHDALAGTRGVVMSVARCEDATGEVTWLGVGNVEAILARVADDQVATIEHLMLRGGVVGSNLPPLRVSRAKLAPGDLLVFATDGLRSRFFERIDPRGKPHAVAERLYDTYGRDTDDSLVVVVRYLGPVPPLEGGA